MNKKEVIPWVILVALLALCFILSSCKEERYIYVTKHDTVQNTVRVIDSVDRWRTHYEYVQGDTVWRIDSVFFEKWHVAHDTNIVVRDSIVYQDRVEVREKKKLVWWPSFVVIGAVIGGAFFVRRRLTK